MWRLGSASGPGVSRDRTAKACLSEWGVGPRPAGSTQASLLCELAEGCGRAPAGWRPSGGEHEEMPVGSPLGASRREIAVQRVPDCRVQRHHPRLAELGFADDEPVPGDIAQLQCEGLADAEPGRGHQAEQAMPGQRGDAARRRHPARRLQQPPDVPDRYLMRLRSAVGQATEGMAGRHLVA